MHVLRILYDTDRDTYMCGCIEDKTPQVLNADIEKREQTALVLTIRRITTLDEAYKEISRDYFLAKE